MQIVTGYEGTPHVTAWQDRDLNQGIFGSGTYILSVGSKMAASIVSNNEIRIADGAVVMQGCLGVIQKGTYDTIAIDNGSQGLARHDLICAEYSKNGSTGVESMSLVVIKGTAAATATDPAYTSGDIQNGDTLAQVPLYRVVLSGLTVTGVERLVDEVGNLESGGDAIVYDGGTYLQSGEQLTLRTLTLPAGTYVISAIAQANDTSLSTLRCWIDEGSRRYGSTSYTNDQYTNASAVAVLYSASPFTVSVRARQADQTTVNCIYRVVCRKVG